MLRSLLTPLRAHFEMSPHTPRTSSPIPVREDDGDLNLEDFARDVMIELMRNSVESLKLAQDSKAKAQVRYRTVMFN